jgi:hypothetical protein
MIEKHKIHYWTIVLAIFLLSCNNKYCQQYGKEEQFALVYMDQKISSWIDSGYYDGAFVRIVRRLYTLRTCLWRIYRHDIPSCSIGR